MGDLLESGIDFRVFFGSKAGHGTEFHGQDVQDPCPYRFHLADRHLSRTRCGRAFSQRAHNGVLLPHERNIERRTVRAAADRKDPLVLLPEITDPFRCGENDELHPYGGKQRVLIADVIICRSVPDPLLRIRMADSLLVEHFQDILQLLVAGIVAESFCAGRQRGISCGITLFQKVLQRVFAHEVAFRLVHLPETGIHIDIAEIIAQKEREETVHCGDLRVVKKRLLSLQMRVVGIFLNPLRDRRADPLSHLRSCSLGKSDYQKPVYIQRMISLADHADDPLDQNGRLAASGCRGNKYIVISCLQNPCLLTGKCNCHSQVPL